MASGRRREFAGTCTDDGMDSGPRRAGGKEQASSRRVAACGTHHAGLDELVSSPSRSAGRERWEQRLHRHQGGTIALATVPLATQWPSKPRRTDAVEAHAVVLGGRVPSSAVECRRARGMERRGFVNCSGGERTSAWKAGDVGW
ncbi:hypothetical protein DCS_03478 [Drechmeria coniospora]|uniref:Uncharacterized protein n=1 Tax=Drechmeria coniospora TaxID=98403 RepID=A0A151GHC7_DRECN|nr:hypothetical protein DCS_03478 [Drechmeria coniospora]KYK56478.1 hypothetical protein DCS_03478 [Drechmeria coniospora]